MYYTIFFNAIEIGLSASGLIYIQTIFTQVLHPSIQSVNKDAGHSSPFTAVKKTYLLPSCLQKLEDFPMPDSQAPGTETLGLEQGPGTCISPDAHGLEVALRDAGLKHKLQAAEPGLQLPGLERPHGWPQPALTLLPTSRLPGLQAAHSSKCFLSLPCSQCSLPGNALHHGHFLPRIYSDFECPLTLQLLLCLPSGK